MTDPRFPIGPAPKPENLSPAERRPLIAALRRLPEEIRAATSGLDDQQLDTPYREGGWTLRQVVHHVADSHQHAYLRTKFTLTEHEPTIKPYSEALWAELPDHRSPVEASLLLLEGLHARWTALFDALDEEQWRCRFIHPQLIAQARAQQGTWADNFSADDAGRVPLWNLLSLYAWHGQHHTAHINNLRQQRGW